MNEILHAYIFLIDLKIVKIIRTHYKNSSNSKNFKDKYLKKNHFESYYLEMGITLTFDELHCSHPMNIYRQERERQF